MGWGLLALMGWGRRPHLGQFPPAPATPEFFLAEVASVVIFLVGLPHCTLVVPTCQNFFLFKQRRLQQRKREREKEGGLRRGGLRKMRILEQIFHNSHRHLPDARFLNSGVCSFVKFLNFHPSRNETPIFLNNIFLINGWTVLCSRRQNTFVQN